MPTVTANPPYGCLFNKTDQVWADFLATGYYTPRPSFLQRATIDGSTVEDLPIQLGEYDAVMRRPLIICAATGDTTEGTGATHFFVTATVQIQSFFKETIAIHQARVAWFEDLWQAGDRGTDGYRALAASLTNHDKQFHCHGIYPEQASRQIINGTDGDFWAFTRQFSMCVQWVNGIA